MDTWLAACPKNETCRVSFRNECRQFISKGKEPVAPSRLTSDKAVLGWVLYDFANVIFALGVVGLYLPLWIVDEQGGRDRHIAMATSLATFVIFLSAPRLGLLADRTGRRVHPLAICTTLCAGLTILIGTGGLYQSMLIFSFATMAFGCGLVFYDSLLPVVSTAADRGRISGFGMAAGFGGALLAILTGIGILAIWPDGKPLVFVALGTLFFLGAIPCFLWVRDPVRPAHMRERTPISVSFMLRRCREVPGMVRFLGSRIFYIDATNTMFAFMAVYATKEVGFSDLQTQLVLLAGILTGPIGAIGSGRMVDRIGPKRTLDRVLILWSSVLFCVAMIPLLNLPFFLFWIVAPVGGLGFGATSTVDRALLIEMVPPTEVGAFFGIFTMVGRFSSVLGPLLWALIADWLGLGRPIAVLALFTMTSTAWWLLRGLPAWLSDRNAARPAVVGETAVV
jgi:UMF1 family MFS transporter